MHFRAQNFIVSALTVHENIKETPGGAKLKNHELNLGGPKIKMHKTTEYEPNHCKIISALRPYKNHRKC